MASQKTLQDKDPLKAGRIDLAALERTRVGS